MKPYKPQWMGSIAPFDDPVAMNDFLKNKFDAFSLIFDSVKQYAESVESISQAGTSEPGGSSFSIAITTTGDTLEMIKNQITNATIFGNIITAIT